MDPSNQRDELAEEIFDFASYSRFAVEEDKEMPRSYQCDCLEHENPETATLREGSYVTAILKRKESPEFYDCDNPIWVVEQVACFDCQVASLYERVDKSSPVAVVEGVIHPSDGCLMVSPRYVWDLHIPNEEAVEP